jgi:hypothetical protein
MLISKAEMAVLRIVGLYMDAPAKMPTGTWGLALDSLQKFGYLKANRAGTSLRLTGAGAEILECAGLKTRTETRTQKEGRVLERRLQNTELALYLCNLGIDVFLAKMPKSTLEPAYLASAELRRQKSSNVLGMSKFLGLLYAPAETYAVYNVADAAEKFYPATDEDVFTRELICANAPAKILYVSEQSLVEIAQAVVESPPAEKGKQSCTFFQAIERFNVPVSLLSFHKSESQMRIILTADYKQKLAKFMLDTGCSPVVADFVDAKFAGGYFIVFIDFDVKRLEQALRVIKDLHILVLTEQLAALEVLLKNRKAETYAIDAQKAFEILEIPEPQNMNLIQYKTEEGVGVIASKSNNRKTKKHV